MSLLPKNELKEKDVTPKMFFIWGESMSGKTYLARQFDNPILLNTDGNAKKVDTPSIEIKDFSHFRDVIAELEQGKHDYETIVIDLVDDIKSMLEDHVCKELNIESLADAPYGKAFNQVKFIWKQLMMRLSKCKFNVVFISHVQEITENNVPTQIPSLEQKYYNMCMGRCDLSIKCRKVGSKYMQLCVNKRDNYVDSDIKNKTILNILKNVTGVFQSTPVAIKKKEVE